MSGGGDVRSSGEEPRAGARAGGARLVEGRAERVVELTAPRVSCRPRALVLGPEAIIAGKRPMRALERGAAGVAARAMAASADGAERRVAAVRAPKNRNREERRAPVGWPLGLKAVASERRWLGLVVSGLVSAVVSAAVIVAIVWVGQGWVASGRAGAGEMGASVGAGLGLEGAAESAGASGAVGMGTGGLGAPEAAPVAAGRALEAPGGPDGGSGREGVSGDPTRPEVERGGVVTRMALGRSVSKLLERRVERVLEGGELGYVRLGELVRGGRVTVLHVWATWCGACEREMPALRGLFAASGWGREVSFVAAQADDTPPLWAYPRFVEGMPEGAVYVVDPELVAGLRATGVAEEGAVLPMTMLFDCRRALRAASAGALDEAGVAALGGAIDALRAELAQAACRPEARVPAPARCGEELCPTTDICARVGAQERCVRRPGGLKGE
jgi:thiol-disulfide isomerase/thioredoxin